MKDGIIVLNAKQIQKKIYSIRETQVMLDNDLAEIYGVETRVLNQAVKRNIDRFPQNFRFQLQSDEYENLKSQIVISSFEHGGRRNLPYAFTEQGVAMLSAVLRSEIAVQISIQIINAFVMMRRFLSSNATIFSRIDSVEKNLLEYKT